MRKAMIGLALAMAAATAGAQDGKGYLAAGLGVSKYSIDFCDTTAANCDDSDFNADDDVDLDDFATFAGCFNGPNSPPSAACPGQSDL